MAKPGELAELIARMFRLEEATVRQQARELRDHGLMSKEKAGRGAGSMTARDAANLLTAAASSTSVKKSVEYVHMYEACRAVVWLGAPRRWGMDFLPSAELSGLHDDHSLIDVVDAVLTAFSVGDWADKHHAFEILPHEPGKISISFNLIGPIVSASSLAVIVEDFDDVDSRKKKPVMEKHYYGDPNEKQIDYKFHAQFTHRTLIEIANLLRN